MAVTWHRTDLAGFIRATLAGADAPPPTSGSRPGGRSCDA